MPRNTAKLSFKKYPLSQLFSIRNLSTAHYLPMVDHYQTPSHHHAAWEFIFCDYGCVSVYHGNNKKMLTANQMILHPPKQNHHFHVGNDPATLVILSFICNSEYLRLLQNKILSVDTEQRKLVLLIVQELYNAFELENGQLLLGDFRPSSQALLGSEQMLTGYIEGLIISLLRVEVNQVGRKWNSEALEHTLENRIAYEIQKFIDEKLSERITIDMIADHLHYSRSYITSQFKKTTGMSISQFISLRRVERAKQLISEGGKSLGQIAAMTGYSSLPYFSTCFKSVVGCCPSEYIAES
ncbi:MAG: AraC family transcriptional regulator [Christensenellales bacterium]